jgi:hypothetical protein
VNYDDSGKHWFDPQAHRKPANDNAGAKGVMKDSDADVMLVCRAIDHHLVSIVDLIATIRDGGHPNGAALAEELCGLSVLESAVQEFENISATPAERVVAACEHHMTIGCIGCGSPDPECDCDEAGEG